MSEQQKAGKGWKILSAVLAVALVAMTCLYFLAPFSKTKPDDSTSTTAQATEKPAEADALSLWTDSAPLKKELTEYIKAVTTEGSKDFIP